MTNHFTARAAAPSPSAARPLTLGPGGLTAGDAERIVAAIDAELAESTPHLLRLRLAAVGDLVPHRGIAALPAAPEALAAYLAPFSAPLCAMVVA